MRRRLQNIIFIILLAGCCSCGVNRRLPAGEKLYYGAKVEVEKAPEVKTKTSVLKNKLADITAPKTNKMLLGQPYKVWLWYAIGQPKKEKGIKYWLRNKFGEAPVTSRSLSPASIAENMETLLENEGYFNSKVVGDTITVKKKLKVLYQAKVERPYMIGPIRWRLDSSQLASDLLQLPKEEARLKTGEQYSVGKIKAEKERLTLLLKEKGYYYFENDLLLTYIDTNHHNYTAAIYWAINQPIPAAAKTPYRINHVVVLTPFTSLQPLPDSQVKMLPQYKGIHIYDSARKFKPDIFSRAITFRKGSLYSLPEQNKSQVRLNSLGTFRFIKTQFTQVADSKDLMDVTYYMAPLKKKKLQTELGGFTRSNSYSGGQLSLQWADKNIFRGAEALVIKATGSFELTPNDSLSANNNWRLGIEASLNIPKLIAPFRASNDFTKFPRTFFPLSYDWVRHQDLYTEHFFNFRYEWRWGHTAAKEYRLTPLNLTVTNTANFTNTFTTRMSNESNLGFVLPTIIIPSLGMQYIVTNNPPHKMNASYLHAGVEFAGTILGFIKGNNGPFSTKIGDSYFMQYLKAAFDYRFYRKLGPNVNWANRLIIGASYPYGNSPFLPFSRQYIIGGANSLRGFIPRHLGPGSTQATELQQSTFPEIGGDYKLEMNTELRYPLGGRFKGAVFIDAGNIWMKDTVLYKAEGKLSKDFIKQLAIDAGLGVRLDVSILILRLDLAMPFHKPWQPEGQRWIFKDMDLGNPDWRDENLVFNFAIGYPF
ncbi:BamA/TamA family outer membrane protein [Chitinophagaceae bacterium LB-8]|uniref:BamA/TamA family outer membrane protein n=1 Tax=Paraflavisolibacter caeni TaxID=2982496 RepID=A0A9X3BGM5_9BACT|nr:BamA/TamA family outer membrane protein [Paraflavisolibacter caeni]MCU7548032.1 BamA/TamA family outer membrane protein [Paraflavisolibacter caeni]